MTLKTEEAIKIAEKIRENIEKNPLSIANLRMYYNLVELIEVNDEINWINSELRGYIPSKNVPNYRKVYHHEYKDKFVSIDDDYITLWALCDSGKNYTYTLTPKSGGRYDSFTIRLGTQNYLYILNTVDNEIYRKTIAILNNLKFEKMEFDIFEETRKSVNEKLQEICPNAFEKLTQTYEDLKESESSLDLQKISFACRTVINDFANAVYKPTEEQIKGFDNKFHPLEENNYVNRIIQFTFEKIDSDHNSKFMKSNLEYLANFLGDLYKLTNVGTHTEREKEHARRCVIYTYLAIGDIINLTKLNLK